MFGKRTSKLVEQRPSDGHPERDGNTQRDHIVQAAKVQPSVSQGQKPVTGPFLTALGEDHSSLLFKLLCLGYLEFKQTYVSAE